MEPVPDQLESSPDNPPADTSAESGSEQQWWVFQRVQEVRSAWSINLIRTVGVLVYYGIHLASYLSLEQATPAQQNFHFYASLIFAGWLLLCGATFFSYATRYLPSYAKYVSTISDIGFLTAASAIGLKTGSSLVVVYPLIIATAAVRFNLKLVVSATAFSLMGYLILVGLADSKWFDENHETPLPQVFMMLTAILLSGAIAAQICLNCKAWMLRERS